MDNNKFTDPYEIAKFIKEAKKTTPIKLYINGDIEKINWGKCKVFKGHNSAVVFGELIDIEEILNSYKEFIEEYELEFDRRNSAIPLLDTNKVQARIEPGAIIRDRVSIGKGAVIMMGAVINIGAEVGEGSMVDMNAVIGARGTLGKNVHLGAGAVIAGVLEPPSKSPVIIEDDVMIGANAVILEGVLVGKGSVIAAGSVVIDDIPENSVAAGSPAKVIKIKDKKTIDKTKILKELRDL